MINPYLDDFRKMENLEDDTDFKQWMETNGWDHYRDDLKDIEKDIEAWVEKRRSRDEWVKQYAWAIPTEKAIQKLCDLSPIVEIGAGTGYWASLVKQLGGEIVCYDKFLNHNKWFSVLQGGPEVLSKYPDYTLFLCWPPYATSLAFDCLKAYQGKHFVYVGEDDSGCTGCDDFHELRHKQFVEIEEIKIPQYHGIHDCMFIGEKSG